VVKHSELCKKLMDLYEGHARMLVVEDLCTRILDELKVAMSYNGFFLHPENVTIGMLASEDIDQRHMAYSKIVEARKSPARDRIFRIPKDINFEAKTLGEVTQTELDIEPPLTADMSIITLQDYMVNGGFTVPFKNHSQDTERSVATTSSVMKSCVGRDNKIGMLLNKIANRKRLPNLDRIN
jgi:cytochrome c biogenesis protein ResB